MKSVWVCTQQRKPFCWSSSSVKCHGARQKEQQQQQELEAWIVSKETHCTRCTLHCYVRGARECMCWARIIPRPCGMWLNSLVFEYVGLLACSLARTQFYLWIANWINGNVVNIYIHRMSLSSSSTLPWLYCCCSLVTLFTMKTNVAIRIVAKLHVAYLCICVHALNECTISGAHLLTQIILIAYAFYSVCILLFADLFL